MATSMEFQLGSWGPPTDHEPDAIVSQAEFGWAWWAAGQAGKATSLEAAQKAAEAAFYQAQCTTLRSAARDALHDLDAATRALRALLEAR